MSLFGGIFEEKYHLFVLESKYLSANFAGIIDISTIECPFLADRNILNCKSIKIASDISKNIEKIDD